LLQTAAGFVGKIPSLVVTAQPGMLQALPSTITPSEAHQEISRRRNRSPRQVAEELGKVYGRDFTQPTYILAMALIAQLRLGNTADVLRAVEPYLSGARDSFAAPSQSSLASHMLF